MVCELRGGHSILRSATLMQALPISCVPDEIFIRHAYIAAKGLWIHESSTHQAYQGIASRTHNAQMSEAYRPTHKHTCHS